jgi:VWFA-related protein
MKSRAANIYFSPFLEPNSDNLTVEETLARRGLPPGVSLEASAHMDSLQQNFYVSHRIEMTIDAFTEIAHFVSGTPGRKNLVWLSAAFPVGISLGSDAASGKFGGTASVDPFAENYSPRLREATDRLTLSQVAVYPVDIRGLTPDSPWHAANTHQYQFPREFDGALMDAQLTHGGELQAMDKIAEDTGGHAFYNTNGLEHAMETALDDGSTYYTISYAPTNTKFDGSLRHIRVSLEAKGFQQLSYRRSYFADHLTAHMASEGFPEQVNREQIRQLSYFTAFVGNKKWHGIKVQRFKIEYSVFGDQLQQAAAADGARHANLDFVAAAYDAEGRTMSGQLSSVQEKLTLNRLQDISAHGYRIRQHLDVPTTAAWLRICVRDALDDRAGCVESPLHQTQTPTAPMQPPHP